MDSSHGRESGPLTASEKGTDPTDAYGVLQKEGLASRKAAEIVRDLTDKVGPRLAGSKGDRLAVEWAVETMNRLGLRNVHPESMKVPHWERGEETALLLGSQPRSLVITALGGSPPTPGGRSGLEAEVLEVDSLDALDHLPREAVRGRIVFVNAPMERTASGEGYGKAVRVRNQTGKKAADKGAVAALIRSIGTDHDRFAHTGVMGGISKGEAVPTAALSAPDADLLHRTLGESNSGVRIRLTLTCGFRPETQSANVLGEWPGTDRADEIVVVGAHLDSWDLGSGAIDDGAGVGAVLEAARLLQQLEPRPRRTLRVVLFAAEENSLAGAKDYAARHAAEIPRHVAALEVDEGTARVLSVGLDLPTPWPSAFAALSAPLERLGVTLSKERSFSGADLIPLVAAGVPGIAVQQDMTTYFDYHHTLNDTFDKIDAEALAQVATSVAFVAYGALSMEGSLRSPPRMQIFPK